MAKTSRGRPRLYDRSSALAAASQVFWTRGYAATSLDALSEATGMKRPSLYAAFGNKEALFEACLDAFAERMKAGFADAMARDTLSASLDALLTHVVSVYAAPSEAPKGCLVFAVASAEAVADPRLGEAVADSIRQMDAGLTARFRVALAAGEISGEQDPRALARLTAAVVHSLSVRARAGASRRGLLRFARESVTLVLRAASAG